METNYSKLLIKKIQYVIMHLMNKALFELEGRTWGDYFEEDCIIVLDQ